MEYGSRIQTPAQGDVSGHPLTSLSAPAIPFLQRTLPLFQAFNSVSYAMVSPLGFSLANFFHGAPLSLSHLSGLLFGLSLIFRGFRRGVIFLEL